MGPWRVAAGGLAGAVLGLVSGFIVLMGALVYTSWRLQGEQGEAKLGPFTLGRVEVSGNSTVTEVASAVPVLAVLLVAIGGLLGIGFSLRRRKQTS